MVGVILTLNAGSSSLKFGVFGVETERQIDEMERGEIDAEDSALTELLARTEGRHGAPLVAVGHRIVHGGRAFVNPVRLDDNVVRAIETLTPLAPLHQPRSLWPVRLLRSVRPEMVQIGCFDTAFHHRLSPPVSRFAIPREYEDKGVRRYGFHGLSYAYIATRLHEAGLASKRTVVAHLGSGASLCAMRDGESIDTTMGFSALDGLVMSTRCGAIDPGILLWLQRTEGLTVDELEDLLYRKSGLLGISGRSGDVRDLLTGTDPRDAEAIALFTFSVARETAAMAQTLGGLECLVFTGGIGAHSQEIRALVCERLAWLGVTIDGAANARGADRISHVTSPVDVRVIATDEEIMIARGVASLLSGQL